MRQTHAAGEKLFVDWAGATVPIDTATRAERRTPTSSSRCWGHPTTPMPRRAGANRYRSGSAPTSMRSRTLAACPAPWCANNLKAGVTATTIFEPELVNLSWAK